MNLYRYTALMIAIFTPTLAIAGVGKISGPEVEKGEFEAKYLLTHTEDDNDTKDSNEVHRAEFEYGFTENWAGEIGFKFEDKYREDFDLKATYFEATRTFTRQHEGWWLSSGLVGEYVINTDSGPDKIESQLRLQRNQDQFRIRFNTTLEREIGGGAEDETELGTNASVIYKLHPNAKPGVEWHAEWGTINEIADSNKQGQWVGPALYGDLFTLGDGSTFEYQAAYVFGLTDASEDGVARFILEYKTHF